MGRITFLIISFIFLFPLVTLAILKNNIPQTHAATPTMLKFVPLDDASVSSRSGTTNGTSLLVENTKVKTTRTFLKFQVSGLTGAPISAKVLLRSTKNSKEGGAIAKVSSNNWSESTITWVNQPAIDGPTLANVGAIRNVDYYEWSVTSVISGDGIYSFGLTCNSCTSAYNSSEATDYLPYLVVQIANEPTPPPTDPSDPVIVGAGDIAGCDTTGDEATANLLDAILGTVFTAGDNAYPNGTLDEFNNCYHPTWGRHKARTKPSVGNHEYNTVSASGYFTYFGGLAGDPAKGYYSYSLGSWHIVALNSNCSQIGGCGVGSPQEQWLRADLAANPASCTLAYWHHARFSSGASHGSNIYMKPFWQAFYDYGGDVVIVGHDHTYERFIPQDPNGVTDLDGGIRQFVVGTGGRSHYTFKTPVANSLVRNGSTYGVLKLTLHPTSYEWQFIPEAGKTFTDSGTAVCQ